MRNIALTSLALALAVTGLSACNSSHDTQVVPPSHALSQEPVATVDPSTEDSHGGDAHDVHAPAWAYTGDTGPTFWGNSSGNEACSIGSEQSPINITTVQLENTPPPKPNFTVSDLNIVNNGHTVVYTPTDNSNTSLINGEVYTLVQFHYHAPSEHQVSGGNYPAELHFVHANAAGNLAVLGVMLNPSSSTPTLGRLLNSSELVTKSGKSTTVSGVDLRSLIPAATGYYHYEGSLTTPPCSEKVKWYVAELPLAVSGLEVRVLDNMYSGNNRPIQPLGERRVVFLK